MTACCKEFSRVFVKNNRRILDNKEIPKLVDISLSIVKDLEAVFGSVQTLQKDESFFLRRIMIKETMVFVFQRN